MKKSIIMFTLFFAAATHSALAFSEPSDAVTLIHMPDGQFKNHLVRVYTDRNIGKVNNEDITLTLRSKDTKPASS